MKHDDVAGSETVRSHEAAQDVKRDIQRDAARTRAADSYDTAVHIEEDASRANETIDPELRDAY